MEAIQGAKFGNVFFYVVVGLILAGVVGALLYTVLHMRNTIPSGFEDLAQEQMEQAMEGGATEEEEEKQEIEGFFGGVARGAGIPDCFQSNTSAAALFSTFLGRVGSVEEGTPDLQEFKLLLSQLGCFKKDLIGVGGVVDATRYQPFATQINMEPIAETTARCFAKTIPKRDLALIFDKFKRRGNFLLTRLCTAADLSEDEIRNTEKLFQMFLKDVKEIAYAKCLAGEPTIDARPISPRDPVPRTPEGLEELRKYKGYY
jgi:hypothetical protein